jgi:hypothetical protein
MALLDLQTMKVPQTKAQPGGSRQSRDCNNTSGYSLLVCINL